MYCVVEVQTHAFLSSVVEVGEWSAAGIPRSKPREDYPESFFFFSEGEFMSTRPTGSKDFLLLSIIGPIFPRNPARSLVPILTELHQFPYCSSYYCTVTIVKNNICSFTIGVIFVRQVARVNCT